MESNIEISLPEDVNFIIQELDRHGFESYAVGGCIRDSLLKKEPDDWDITTEASPCEVKSIFKKTIDTGLKHGTVTVMIGKNSYEVTTYRIDGKYKDGRHPDSVEFTKSLKEDLKRRDFTINAMAYNDLNGIVDIFGGINDIQNHIIKCVGSAEERFGEDALRILRAYRFSAQFGFDIDKSAVSAAKKKADTLKYISAERINTELSKLLMSYNPNRLIMAYDAGITGIILPEFDKMLNTSQENFNHIYNVGVHTIKALEWLACECKEEKELNKKQRLILRLTLLLHDCAKPECKTIDENGIAHFYGHDVKGMKKAEEVLRRLKFDNETIDYTTRLIKFHDYRFSNAKSGCTSKGIRRALKNIGKDVMELLFIVERADAHAQNPAGLEEKLRVIDEAEKIYKEVINSDECFNLKNMALNGNDLINAGISAGPELGNILNELLEHVIEVPEDNKKNILMELVFSKYKNRI